MSAASNYLENKVLDHALGTSAFTAPSNVYLALFTSDPGEDASGTEVSGTNYVRKAITFDAASGGSADSAATVTFDAAGSGGWGTISHVAIFDASSSGNMLFYGAVTASKTIDEGDTFQVSAGNLTISLD